MTHHFSEAGKVNPGDRVSQPVKIACKPELTLTRLLPQHKGNPLSL